MNEQEVIAFMLESLNKDNRDICTNNGMAPDEIEKSIEQSQGSLAFMMSNLYNRMKEKNLIV